MIAAVVHHSPSLWSLAEHWIPVVGVLSLWARRTAIRDRSWTRGWFDRG